MRAAATVVDASGLELRAVSARVKEMVGRKRVIVKNATHLHGLAGGLKGGEVVIDGDSGDYLGVLNAGATIWVRRNAGRFVADNMTAGTVIVEGDAPYGAAMYCYGGTVVIRGNAGDFSATMNKGATILIAGNAGDEVATYMLAGDVVIVGNAGHNLANYLIRGTVYVGGEIASLGHNTQLAPLTEADRAKLRHYFEEYRIKAEPERFKKVVAKSTKPFYA